MPKPITLEMLQDMTPAQRTTLRHNASNLDTDDARAVLALLAQGDPVKPPQVPVKKRAARKAPAKPKNSAAKPLKAVHGRTA